MAITPPADRPQINAKVACSGPLEPANSARRGHPRTVPHAKMSSKGRIELRISQSRAKIDQEVAGDVRFCIAPQKTGENVKKNKNFSEKFSRKKFFGVEKRNVGNRLKHVLAKFRSNWSLV